MYNRHKRWIDFLEQTYTNNRHSISTEGAVVMFWIIKTLIIDLEHTVDDTQNSAVRRKCSIATMSGNILKFGVANQFISYGSRLYMTRVGNSKTLYRVYHIPMD